MNDVERDLRALLDRKAGSVGGVAPRLPEQVRARGRRRQLGTALVGGLTVIALVVGSVGVLRTIDDRSDRRPTPADDIWADYEVFERTATIETVTISSPSDWFLVNQWPLSANSVGNNDASGATSCEISIPPGQESSEVETCEGSGGSGFMEDQPFVLPLALLSATDIGLGTSPCLTGNIDWEGDEAVLEVAVDTRAVDRLEAGEDLRLPPWPVEFDEETTSGPCGEGHYARFQVGRYPYVAFAGFGPGASDEDREKLFELAHGMEVDGQRFVQGTLERTPSYVVAAGENAAGPWRLELRASTSDAPTANVELSVVSFEGGAGAGDFTVPHGSSIEQAGGDPVFGAVTKEAAGVEIGPNVMLPGPAATIVPLPPSLPFDFDLFFASHGGDEPPLAVPVDAAGDPIGNVAGMSGGGNIKQFEILGTGGVLATDRSTGITCYAVTSDHGFIDGCAEKVTMQTIPLPGEGGQILVFSHVDAIRLSGLEVDVDGGETITGSTCQGPVCVMGIPSASGSGRLWLLQHGQRADSATIAWTPTGVERT